jgi:hypothetical protein
LVALALAATFFAPSVYVATQDLTGVPNLADLIARCAVLLASFGAQSLLLHLTQEPIAAIRMSRRRAVALASTMVLLVVLFMLAPVHVTGTLRLTSDFGGSPWVIGYLVVFAGYLGIALVDVLRGGLRYAPKAGTPISMALRLIAIGCGFGLLYVAEKIGYLIAVLLGSSPSAAVESSVARMLAVVGGLFVLVGSLVPALYPAWRRTVHRVSAYRAHRELHPLWSALRELHPEIALDPASSDFRDRLRVRDLDFRLYRRIIEIRDAQWLLVGGADAGVDRTRLGTRVSEDELPYAMEALALRTAIESGSRPGPPTGSPSAGGPDVDAEVRALLAIARWYHRIRASAAAEPRMPVAR